MRSEGTPTRPSRARWIGPRLIVVVLAACRTCIAAEGPTADPGAPVAPAPRAWAISVAGNAYLFPDDEDFTLGIAAADRGPLHLEARYNYEALETGSLWAGWNWSTGKTVELQVTPMLGAVFGDVDGVAPGLELSLVWGILDYYVESEVVFDLEEDADSFTYAWSELAVSPLDWLRVGIVGQRTRVFETERDVQRGVLAQVVLGPSTLGLYWFDPGGGDAFTVALVQLDF